MSAVELDYRIVRMTEGDVPTVLRNERRAYTHPWTEGIFLDCVRSGYECWLFVLEGRNLGHGILSVAAGESHLLNVCINPSVQGRGYGRVLVDFMLERARVAGADRVFLEVRQSNAIAYQLYETLGFNEVGVRHDYYPAFVGREDALVLAREFV